jgi:integrase
LPRLTPHCLRHQAITKLLESGASPETVRQIAGHVGEAMLKIYSHSRFKHQATALECLDTLNFAEEARHQKRQPKRELQGATTK